MYENKQELENILPHKRSMVLIDRVKEYDLEQKTMTVEVSITPDSMFFDKETNCVPVWVGIEYMVQAVGAMSGIYNKSIHSDEKPKLGFLLGSRKYECFKQGFMNGETLSVHIKELYYDERLAAFYCEIEDENHDTIASAQVNAFKPASEKELLHIIQENEH